MKVSRRDWLKGALSVSGAALGTRLAGNGWLGSAAAQSTKKAAVLSIFFEGGFNAIFSSADSFLPKGDFGVSALSVKNAGNGLVVDGGTIGTLGSWALGHMAAIGNRHGLQEHSVAQKTNFVGDHSYVVQLASAIGGPSAYKAIALGNLPPGGAASDGSTSIQLLRTLPDVGRTLGLGPIDYGRPSRPVAGRALDRARAMSQTAVAKNKSSMSPLSDAYTTLVDSLGRPAPAIDLDAIATAYGASSGAGLDTFASKLAAAELVIRAGTNVVTMTDTGWDTHGDGSGTTVRNKMRGNIPHLKKFIDRLQSEPALAAMNVSVILHGDFARSLPIGDHAAVLSALVIGPNVKVGTTGKVTANVGLPEGTGTSKEMWSYLADISKVAKNPFGANPHGLVL